MRQLPTAEHLVATGRVPAEVEVAVLRQGRATMIQTCTDCHRLFWPEEYRPASWRPLMKRMARRASLGSEATDAMTQYVVAASKKHVSDR